MDKWRRVSRGHPCPICKRPDWCLVTHDGAAVLCMRVTSDAVVQLKRDGGSAYLHKLGGSVSQAASPPVRVDDLFDAPVAPIDMARQMALYASRTLPGHLRTEAQAIGVSTASLTRLGAAVARGGDDPVLALPMRDAEGTIIGIRLRSRSGRKWSVIGSHQGLFLPDGQLGDQCDQVVVVEGPTDAAAMLDLGYYAIGRPSCTGCQSELVQLLRRRDVVILADRDPDKTRPDGTTWNPGMEGATRLAGALLKTARSVKLLRPPRVKDAREWLRSGATPAVARIAIDNARYWTGKEDTDGRRLDQMGEGLRGEG